MGTHYAHTQVTNRAISIFIAESYLAHYGKNLSDESLARLWQGGPKGAKKSSTRAYARRVMRELERRTVKESMTVQFTENPTTFTAR
jgi:hypothetical protein